MLGEHFILDVASACSSTDVEHEAVVVANLADTLDCPAFESALAKLKTPFLSQLMHLFLSLPDSVYLPLSLSLHTYVYVHTM